MAVTVKHWATVEAPAETVPRPAADAPRTPIYEALLREWSRDGRTVPGEQSGPLPSPWPGRRERYDTAFPYAGRTVRGAGGPPGAGASTAPGTPAPGTPAPAAPASAARAAPLPAEEPTPGQAEAGWQRVGRLSPSPRPAAARSPSTPQPDRRPTADSASD